MALSEIEKLERRYAENPQGLTFAPLAEVHRKNGQVQRALDLLGPGLAIHPDYIPANIVLGRCHMDLGDVQAAEKAFLHVLALDGENVIALKALADISERLLKFDEAERWLQTLLSVDRSNDDAREQMQRVEVSRRQAKVASSAEPSSVNEPESEVTSATMEDLAPQERPGAPVGLDFESPTAVEEPVPEHVELDASLDFEETVEPPEAVEPIYGLVGREVDEPGESASDFRVETSEDIILESAGGTEFQVPDASEELSSWNIRRERAPFEEDAPVAPGGSWDAPRAEHARPETVEPEPVEPEPVDPEPVEPELFEPEAVEPQLATPERHPAEFSAPEPGASESPVVPPLGPADFRQLRKHENRDAAQPPAAPPKRSYSVVETGGRSVTHLFKAILSARPPLQASAPPVRQTPAADSAGAPTRPAADALSLSSVFGEEGPETPPAVPASTQGPGAVSFDDFFTSPSASPARAPRAPDPKSDDLDQFHAWLQNLKR